jgi:hypothetical protein
LLQRQRVCGAQSNRFGSVLGMPMLIPMGQSGKLIQAADVDVANVKPRRVFVHDEKALMKGTWVRVWGVISMCALGVLSTGLMSPALAAASGVVLDRDDFAQDDTQDEIDRLRAMLQRSGPEGRADRASAVAQLLRMPKIEAHRLLHEYLQKKDDPDGLRITILEALHSELLGNPATQFGGASETLRKLIVTGYLGSCAPLWKGANDVENVSIATVRIAARQALRRVPVRELDVAARTLMTTVDPEDGVFVLRCLADMQQTLLAQTIADQLESPEQIVRDGAQRSLQLLTYADQMIRTKADFALWFARFGTLRYVDLAERAARNGPRTYSRLRDELERFRVLAAREFVAVNIAQQPGINWPVVQERTLSDGPAVLDACLKELQVVLGQATSVEGAAAGRQAFFRALLDRFAKVPDAAEIEIQRRRALLLEVAAYLVRPQETEFANEIRGLLVKQLALPSIPSQVAALRGIRRFPSPDARSVLVQRARQMLADSGANKEPLQVILDTLAARKEPRWDAPSIGDADKSDWLTMIDECCRTKPELELRRRAQLLATTLDKAEKRVPEAFGVLLSIAKDSQFDAEFRRTCLIYLDSWRKDTEVAEQWLVAMHELMAESKQVSLRRQAAESLVRLPESVDPRRAVWFASTLSVLRDRLLVEPDAGVLKALIECLEVIGRAPQMSTDAIDVLASVLAELGSPVDSQQAFRLEPLLQALAAIAAEPDALTAEWVAACGPLLSNGSRESLRLVLASHDAVNLAKDVAKAENGAGALACKAMRLLIDAAALKPETLPWESSDALKAEARDVRTAFEALDSADVTERLDAPQHRLVRLSVDLAAGRYQEVVQRATAWLVTGEGQSAAPDEVFSDRLRLLAAEAQLELSKPLEALKLLEARSANAAADQVALALSSRIALALVDSELDRAVSLLERTMRATSTESPTFRARLLDWMRVSIQQSPENRAAVREEGRRHAGLFESSDCPAKLRTEFEQLQGSN